MASLLKVEGLAVRYGGVQALLGIDVEVASGEVVAILGANGAGKTTLVRALSGLVPKAGGRVTFDGQDLTRAGSADIVGAGLIQVPEGRDIFAAMSVKENLLMGGYRFPSVKSDQLDMVFELFPRLKERLDQRAGTLSGGEQQMLAIGRALLSQPKLLMLDEPSLGLAPMVVKLVFDTLETLAARGTTLLVVEQNARRALALATRAYVITNGRVQLSGAAAELASSPEIVAAYLGGATAKR
ncbi:MAG: ABC transporter ATP-binding protein [Alphaproteobacteria bacterium]